MAKRVLDEDAHDLQYTLLIAEGSDVIVSVQRSVVPPGPGDGPELLAGRSGGCGEVDLGCLDAELAGVEPREVEEVGRQLRQPLHLVPRLREELPTRLLVEILVVEKLQEPAQGEEGVRSSCDAFGDELTAGVVQVRRGVPACESNAPPAVRPRQRRCRPPAARSRRPRSGPRPAPGGGAGA